MRVNRRLILSISMITVSGKSLVAFLFEYIGEFYKTYLMISYKKIINKNTASVMPAV